MQPIVWGEFGVEAGGENAFALDQNRIPVDPGQNSHPITDPADPGRADEHSPECCIPVPGKVRLERLALATIGVASHVDIDQSQGTLLRPADLSGQEDEPGAGTEQTPASLVETGHRLTHPGSFHELEHGGAFATGNDEPAQAGQFVLVSNFPDLAPQTGQARSMQVEVALQGQNTDSARGSLRYHPRVCSSSPSGTEDTLMPTIASPRFSLTFSNTSASR
jgi:hypothetical protein